MRTASSGQILLGALNAFRQRCLFACSAATKAIQLHMQSRYRNISVAAARPIGLERSADPAAALRAYIEESIRGEAA
jgi:hypothetical protein